MIGETPRISEDPVIQRRYEELRRNGESHRMAEVLACRKFPHFSGTNDDWMRGRENGKQFEGNPWLGEHYKRVAERAGVSTTGKIYCTGVAAYPGDPRAWVSDTSDVLAVARERNLTVDGIIKHQGHQVEPTKDIEIAPDILAREAIKLSQSTGMKFDEAVDKAYALRTGRVDPNPALVDDHTPSPEDVIARDGG